MEFLFFKKHGETVKPKHWVPISARSLCIGLLRHGFHVTSPPGKNFGRLWL